MMELTSDQSKARDYILSWYKENKDTYSVLTLGGYAGTGKTTLIAHIRKDLGDDISVSFISFTGKAVSVMRRKLTKLTMSGDTISTIHSFMYRPVVVAGKVVDWTFKYMAKEGVGDIDEAPYADLIVMDEASMTPKNLMTDLAKYDKPILAVGDHGQLPPVEGNFSLMKNPTIKLEKILRQAEDSPILKLAHRAREGKRIPIKKYAEGIEKLTFNHFDGSAAEHLMAEPNPETMVIVPWNKTRVAFNKKIRKYFLGEISEPPMIKDRVICLRNDHKLGIYNGMTGGITSVMHEHAQYMDHNYRFTFTPDENVTSPITVDALKCLFHNETGEVKKDIPYRERGSSFDYGYVITCHKAQGSEADNVVIFGDGFGDADLRRRWLYTAITRAKKSLYLVER